ncbi:class F sortase [Sinomonas soli]
MRPARIGARHERQAQRAPRGTLGALAAAVAAGALLSAAAVADVRPGPPPVPAATASAATPATGPTSSASASPAPSPSRTKSAKPSPPARATPAAAAPRRLDYPGAQASVAVLPLTPTADDLAARSLTPPETMDAYWLANYGRPGAGSADTTYIVAHRWVGTDAPFNRIGERARAGDAFTLATAAGTLRYRVTAVADYSKAALSTSRVWDAVPGRVVLITCDFADPWGTNTVITAEPQPGT